MIVTFDEQLENLKQRLLWGSKGNGCYLLPAHCEEAAHLIEIVLHEHLTQAVDQEIKEAQHENGI